MRRATAGRLEIGGRDITTASLNQRVDAGMAYIPEERMRDGAIREFSVKENVFLHDHSSAPFARGIFLRFSRMEEHARDLVKQFAVKTPGLDTPLKNLSGGNIQKLIMARELSRKPLILIAAQPTRGVDISASAYIHQRLLQQREEGTGILLISEDLDEVRALSDRIAVMYEGRITGILQRGQGTVEQIGLMMAGERGCDGTASGSADRVSWFPRSASDPVHSAAAMISSSRGEQSMFPRRRAWSTSVSTPG